MGDKSKSMADNLKRCRQMSEQSEGRVNICNNSGPSPLLCVTKLPVLLLMCLSYGGFGKVIFLAFSNSRDSSHDFSPGPLVGFGAVYNNGWILLLWNK